MDITDFTSIGIVGIALSTIIEIVKNKYSPESLTTKLITISLSIVLGTGYVLLANTPLWPTIIGVLGVASAFYAIFIK